jgi:ribonuclease HII
MLFPDQNDASKMVVCGVDETGYGSAVAEVYVGACVLDPARPIPGLADSKTLTARRREALSKEIREKALAWCIATASLEEIEQHNVLHATHLAMARAISGLKVKPDIALIDGNRLPPLDIPARAIIKGDATIPAISAASILAKVARDEALVQYHQQYPQYGFAQHKGYLTRAHMAALRKFGPCPLHRKSYAPIRKLLDLPPARNQLRLL